MSSPNDFAHLKIPIEDILSATNNFADENVIETADFGNIYKGQFLWSGELINISARRIKTQRKQAEQEFWMEISMLASLKHKNLVSLVGFCDENDEKVIINMNETRGWLDEYLSNSMSLTWVRRLEICVGLAHALSYIHHDETRDFSVIHRNIRSGTVQLNDDWEPKLSNFERSMKIEASERHHSFHTNTLEYTNGYGDPTYLETKSVNHKSDIYSYGIVLLEVLCGRKSIIDDDYNNSCDCLNEEHRTSGPNKYERFVKRLEKDLLELQLNHENDCTFSFYTDTLLYTDGYGDPTYIETKRVNHKSDMYSFGIVLFEVLCGRDSIIDDDYNKYLAPVAITHYREKKLHEIIDWDLWEQMDSQAFNIFTETAYDCLKKEGSQRPNIDEIVPRLEKALELQREHQNKVSQGDQRDQ
ncbi:kinase-like domain, phloem protein 2-like protein [Tanacetum coccineum]|uniref:Kinase-like domain, phloem protein 2-like protein n=1 Tax=Tanacetum coccineum TaxID=301880 RepID=A0ABQ5JCK3_9ASTR